MQALGTIRIKSDAKGLKKNEDQSVLRLFEKYRFHIPNAASILFFSLYKHMYTFLLT